MSQQAEQVARLSVDDRHAMNVVQTQLADGFQHRRVWTDGQQRPRTNVSQQV